MDAMVKFFRAHLSEQDREIIKIVALAFVVGGVCGAIFGAVLNHEIAEVNAARVAQEILCP
ncbi:unnamed protein product [marine sediment metagenome]|uniref:Uncharacterized protein n=1 Tax=marine sediment metagenome TaxID=412755 RepID=X0XLZ7_9ZZZZ